MTFTGKWEQRWHPLRREWVVYSAHRNTRPWVGITDAPPPPAPDYDPSCFLCPGNARISGHRNPGYEGVYVFENDHPVLGQKAPRVDEHASGVFKREPGLGRSRVLCYDPRHNVTLADVEAPRMLEVLEAWKSETKTMLDDPGIRHLHVFENRGEMVGASSPHPHCQIYAGSFVFKNVALELDAMAEWKDGNLFDAVLKAELDDSSRVISRNEHAVAFVPFFARFPYEVWLFPLRRHATLVSMSREELAGVGAVYQDVLRKFERLWNLPFPYIMSVHQAPVDGSSWSDYHLHVVFLPPLRLPGLRKFVAGAELGGGNFMCDAMPEDTAEQLRRAGSR